MMKILEAKDIFYSYNNPLLKNVNLTLKAGEIVSLTGTSGCGKTTLLLILAGSLKPQRGKVELHCQERELCFLYQDPHLMEGFNALENILISGLINKVKKPEEKARNLMRKLGIEHLAKSDVTSLSAGERQRVAIAQVMIKTPKLILADEVTGNLDQTKAQLVLSLLREISENSCVFLVTHDPEVARSADRSLILLDGTIC